MSRRGGGTSLYQGKIVMQACNTWGVRYWEGSLVTGQVAGAWFTMGRWEWDGGFVDVGRRLG